MKIIEMPLTDVVSPENNIRIHSEKQIDEYIRSLKMFDQIRPIVVDENNVVLCGNGMVMALRKMKKTTVYVYKRTDLSENEKKKLMIADNKIFSLGIDNISTLDAFLEDLRDDLDIPGSTKTSCNLWLRTRSRSRKSSRSTEHSMIPRLRRSRKMPPRRTSRRPCRARKRIMRRLRQTKRTTKTTNPKCPRTHDRM